MKPLILASTSPRRAALLAEAGIAFEPLDPGVKDTDEEALAERWRARGLAPGEVAQRLAVTKALAAARRAPRSGLVLAADTVVAVSGRSLGKPRDAEHARSMIELLAGKAHEVVTGIALLDLASGKLEAETETSRVRFNDVDAATLDRFLASGTWAGKAGAYGVQDEASRPLVSGVEGSRSNVVGLPVERVRALLARVGVLLLALGLAGCPSDGKGKPDVVATPASNVAPAEDPVKHENEPFVPETSDGLPSRNLPVVKLRIADVEITAELATTEDARRLGLMHRDSMPDDHGMLFVYPERQKDFHNFWMKNTRIPLSLAYLLDDGTIVNLEDMEPFDTETKHPSKQRVRLGLELNKGWFRIHGVAPGARIEGISAKILAKGE